MARRGGSLNQRQKVPLELLSDLQAVEKRAGDIVRWIRGEGLEIMQLYMDH